LRALVNAQQALNLKRQIFFVRVGGWDLHDNQVTAGATTSGAHANLLRDVSRSMFAFHRALTQIGAENQVTTFTASDFGRTYNTNGDGSDHGWGSHHFVMGGAVRGGDIYGKMPTFAIDGPDDTGRGRWIPTTSVDEYAGTLAKWFGVSATDLPLVSSPTSAASRNPTSASCERRAPAGPHRPAGAMVVVNVAARAGCSNSRKNASRRRGGASGAEPCHTLNSPGTATVTRITTPLP
jgi:uncharacterized protein (DUF1501 family)